MRRLINFPAELIQELRTLLSEWRFHFFDGGTRNLMKYSFGRECCRFYLYNEINTPPGDTEKAFIDILK